MSALGNRVAYDAHFQAACQRYHHSGGSSGAIANAALAACGAEEMLAALRSAEIAVEQLCYGQDPANQCWVTLADIRAAVSKAEGVAA